jgi:hypothetical protein
MRRHAIALVLAATLALPAGASAQVESAGETGRAPQRVRSVTLEGNETCPKAQGDEVVVCSRLNPDEQFRIPKPLRDTAEPVAKNQAWTNRVATADQVSRVAGGLPDTCSPVGSGGQTGCALAINRAWAAERRAAEKNDSMIPGGR